jgi:hypothetical protein
LSSSRVLALLHRFAISGILGIIQSFFLASNIRITLSNQGQGNHIPFTIALSLSNLKILGFKFQSWAFSVIPQIVINPGPNASQNFSQ